MKKITFIPFLTFLLLLFSTVIGYSQNTNVTFDNTNASLTTAPACSFSQCNAQDVNFGDVYLGDNVGNVATLAYITNPVNGLYIWVTVSSNSSKYDLLFQFDYLVGGVRKNFDNTNFVGAATDRLTIKIRGSIITAGSKYRMAQITNYTAGQSLELKNIYLSWETSGQAISPAQSLSLITCNPPKCSSALSSGIIIRTPLFADFSINKNCDGGTYQKVVYTSTSTGVQPNTNYSWSFPGAATISPVSLTTIGPYTVTYSSAGPHTVSLTVSDPTNQVVPNTKTVNNITLVACCTAPVITPITGTSICSEGTFTVTPANGTNGTVPAGTTYSWAAPSVIGISGTAAGSNAANISGTLTNTTNAPINVVYTVTPTSGICTGSTFTVTVTVNPKPALTNITASTICSGGTFTVTPVNGTNGTVPSGTTYSWAAPIVIGISGTAAGSNAANISGTLTNTTNAPINVVYTVTPTSGTCTGSTFTVTVTVNPLPTATITGTIAVCKDATAPNVTFTGAAGTTPYTFTYNINGGNNLTVSTIAGNSVTVTVPTAASGTFVYNLVSVQDSSSTTCSQAQTGTATITVNPLPICSIIGSNGPLCPSTTGNSYSAPAGMSNYSWSVSGNATIPGNTSSQTVLVTTGAGCGASFTLTLNITDNNGCQSTCSQTVNVQDTTAPTWTTAPAALDVTLECSDAQGLTTAQANAPVATDNCGGLITYDKVSGSFVAGSCVNSGTYTNTWTA
ncbi:PKD-like domain-containing protein, partial [Flavobacterium sp. JAS]|uniref:PKD-like domain-containing protein n=1 Tax=Flavobacterium sp. JAS TaxID=2897329 RepID=UPI00272E0D48